MKKEIRQPGRRRDDVIIVKKKQGNCHSVQGAKKSVTGRYGGGETTQRKHLSAHKARRGGTGVKRATVALKKVARNRG